MSNAEIDEHILAACEIHWRKVALVLGRTLSTLEIAEKRWAAHTLTKRLRVLMRKGQIEAAGNVWQWRTSEIRLAPERQDGRRVRPT